MWKASNAIEKFKLFNLCGRLPTQLIKSHNVILLLFNFLNLFKKIFDIKIYL